MLSRKLAKRKVVHANRFCLSKNGLVFLSLLYFYISELDIEFEKFACVWDQMLFAIDENDVFGPFCGNSTIQYAESKPDFDKIQLNIK